MPQVPSSTKEVSSKSSNSRVNSLSSKFYHVGWVKQAHGIKGELFIALKASTADWLESCDTLYLLGDQKAELQSLTGSANFLTENEFSDVSQGTFFLGLDLVRARPHKKGFIAVLAAIDNRNLAESLKGLEVWISKDLLVSSNKDEPYLLQILDFSVQDPTGNLIGKVVSFGSNGAQDLLIIENTCGRFEVPFVSAFLVEIRYPEKTLVMDLPEGLVEK